jgi:hypothetical protein
MEVRSTDVLNIRRWQLQNYLAPPALLILAQLVRVRCMALLTLAQLVHIRCAASTWQHGIADFADKISVNKAAGCPLDAVAVL